MKKTDLIQLHGLLAEIRTYAEDRDIPIDTSEYDEVGVEANAVHKSKENHKQAIMALAEDLAESVEVEEADTDEQEAKDPEIKDQLKSDLLTS